jgi:hypothetical protein
MPAPKSKSVHANEGIKPADTPEQRKFMAEMEAEKRAAAAQAVARQKARMVEEAVSQRAKEDAMGKAADQRDKDTAFSAAYDRAVKAPLAKGGSVKKYARGGGIESRGKTRGRMC